MDTRPTIGLRLRTRTLCRLATLAVAACAVAAATVQPAVASTDDLTTSRECREVTVPVTLAAVSVVEVRGTLCHPSAGPAETVQVLVHGGTYDRSYWDFPYKPERYSYTLAATRAGYSTLNIDRIGYGESTQVPSAALSGTVHAHSIHQIIGKLRAGEIGGTRYGKVVLVGHSLGSGITVLEASTYHDVDGVILTGMAHPLTMQGAIEAFTQHLNPAMLDPQFAGTVDPGYLTTIPGQRYPFFYSATNADLQLVAVDEATKDKVSSVEIPDIFLSAFAGPASRAIDVPTLLLNGTEDAVFCRQPAGTDCSSAEAMKADEAAFFAPEACLQTFVLPGAGHDAALALNGGDSYDAMLQWTDTYVTGTPPDPGCGSRGP